MFDKRVASGGRRANRSRVRYPTLFFAIFVALNLHLLRHLSPIYQVVIGVAQLALAVFLLEEAWLRGRRARFYFALFVVASSLAGLHSVMRIGLVYGIEGFVRFNFTLLLAAGAYKYCRNWEITRRLLIIYLALIYIAFLSLPYQSLFGEVSWFVSGSTRGGFDRFPSLLGNLNAVGSILGPVLVLTMTLKMRKSFTAAGMVCCGLAAAFSMQKSALAGVALAVVWWMLAEHPRYWSKRAVQVLALAVLAYLMVQGEALFVDRPQFTGRIDAVLSTAGISLFGVAPTGYVSHSFSRSLYTRLNSAPSFTIGQLANAYGGLGLIWGLGYESAGTSLTNYPRAVGYPHNGYFLLFGVGGLVLTLVFLAVVFHTMNAVRRAESFCRKNSLYDQLTLFRSLQSYLWLFLIVMTFSTGQIFQPNLSSLFWASVGIMIRFRKDPIAFVSPGATSVSTIPLGAGQRT